VSNSGVEHVTRFPAADPSKVQNFKSGVNTSGLGIDSRGNVWVTTRFGNGLLGKAHLIDMGVRLKLEGDVRVNSGSTPMTLDHRLFCNVSKDSRGLNPGPRNGCEIFQPGSPKVKRLHTLTRRMIHPVPMDAISHRSPIASSSTGNSRLPGALPEADISTCAVTSGPKCPRCTAMSIGQDD